MAGAADIALPGLSPEAMQAQDRPNKRHRLAPPPFLRDGEVRDLHLGLARHYYEVRSHVRYSIQSAALLIAKTFLRSVRPRSSVLD